VVTSASHAKCVVKPIAPGRPLSTMTSRTPRDGQRSLSAIELANTTFTALGVLPGDRCGLVGQ